MIVNALLFGSGMALLYAAYTFHRVGNEPKCGLYVALAGVAFYVSIGGL